MELLPGACNLVDHGLSGPTCSAREADRGRTFVLKHSNVVALTPGSPTESRESSESINAEFQVHDKPGFHGERKASKI